MAFFPNYLKRTLEVGKQKAISAQTGMHAVMDTTRKIWRPSLKVSTEPWETNMQARVGSDRLNPPMGRGREARKNAAGNPG